MLLVYGIKNHGSSIELDIDFCRPLDPKYTSPSRRSQASSLRCCREKFNECMIECAYCLVSFVDDILIGVLSLVRSKSRSRCRAGSEVEQLV